MSDREKNKENLQKQVVPNRTLLITLPQSYKVTVLYPYKRNVISLNHRVMELLKEIMQRIQKISLLLNSL